MEFFEDIKDDPKCESLKKAIENFFEQMAFAMPKGGIEDAEAEVEVNILIGKSPERSGKR